MVQIGQTDRQTPSVTAAGDCPTVVCDCGCPLNSPEPLAPALLAYGAPRSPGDAARASADARLPLPEPRLGLIYRSPEERLAQGRYCCCACAARVRFIDRRWLGTKAGAAAIRCATVRGSGERERDGVGPLKGRFPATRPHLFFQEKDQSSLSCQSIPQVTSSCYTPRPRLFNSARFTSTVPPPILAPPSCLRLCLTLGLAYNGAEISIVCPAI
ncbi:hypothetical protein SKAU_G00240240 [Synaphobranchus kaupii]|uniref:Uncharacterized protein n=1 Tax=Synaphobranchus kaupii TaxID=118154 RepID=A0A9Q1F7I0_SYNKA|nr:hypothetical protein SKAU_G00240240 [Synaphobranchus kaupii]